MHITTCTLGPLLHEQFTGAIDECDLMVCLRTWPRTAATIRPRQVGLCSLDMTSSSYPVEIRNMAELNTQHPAKAAQSAVKIELQSEGRPK